MPQPLLEHLSRYQEELVAIRRDLHAHPEIGFKETRTADVVARYLEAHGIEAHRGVGRTGVVGVLRNGNGPAIGLRADMDALPIVEATGLAYASKNPGVMHACGHDGHTTMLLGAAKYLAETKAFNGAVHFIFQPAEEGLGGALAMLEDGLFERFPCEAVYGMHNGPGLEVGHFQIGLGTRMAAGAFFDIRVEGKGAHGAMPYQGIDPVMVAMHIGTALQTIVSRNIDARSPAVLSITRLQAGDSYNVVPQRALMSGTVRAMTRAMVTFIEERMKRLAPSIAEGFGATAEVDFRLIVAPTINDDKEAAIYADAAASLVGEAQLDRNAPPLAGSEDFGFMLEQVPGAHIFFGNGDTAPVHNDKYDFNDAAIPYGAALYAAIVEKKLARGLAD